MFIFSILFDIIFIGDDDMNCIFCKIINNEIPTDKIYEDNIVLVFLDVNPNSPGHMLIIPKKHHKDLNDLDDNTLLHIMKIAQKMKLLAEEKLNADGVKLVQNNGGCQEVKHFHLHIIPYYNEIKEVSNEIIKSLLEEK